MADWSILNDPIQRLLRLYLPEHLSTAVTRAAITNLVDKIESGNGPTILIVDLRMIRHIEPEAPVVGARICLPIVDRIEHAYILTNNAMVRSVASAAAASIGLRYTCHTEEPDLTSSPHFPRSKQT